MNPYTQKDSFKTGTKVFDWEIPEEWDVIDAFIEHSSGNKFADFNDYPK